jgi:phosphatidylglycerophosphatase A
VRPRPRNAAELIALGLGSGLAPRAPGTAGTLVGALLYLALASLPVPAYAAIAALLFGLGVWACGSAERSLGVPDHPAIVWDEVVGFLVAMVGTAPAPETLLVGFVVFRALDIFKPWPISSLDRNLEGGLGIMLDDALAGIGTALVLHLLPQSVGIP